MPSLEFILGLLEATDPASVAWEDFQGPHAHALRLWQDMGFLDREPGRNPVPGCPHCAKGVPYLLGKRCLCNRCFRSVDRRHLLLWKLNREELLRRLAVQWKLRGGVRRIEDGLWQLGTWETAGEVHECFYHRGADLGNLGETRLGAYRNALVFYGLTPLPESARPRSSWVSLLEFLRLNDSLAVTDLCALLRARGNVRFDVQSGTLWLGDAPLGEVPVGTKEFYLLVRLAEEQDHYVPYADLKCAVLEKSGSQDSTEEATFCHRLKNRIKMKGWIPKIDALLSTTNKRNGYRLRGYVEGLGEA